MLENASTNIVQEFQKHKFEEEAFVYSIHASMAKNLGIEVTSIAFGITNKKIILIFYDIFSKIEEVKYVNFADISFISLKNRIVWDALDIHLKVGNSIKGIRLSKAPLNATYTSNRVSILSELPKYVQVK